MKVQIAAVNSFISLDRLDDNLQRAEEYVNEAKARAAQIICFPETFPGPTKEPFGDFSPHAFMSDLAKRKGIYIVYGLIQRVDSNSDNAHYVSEILLSETGKRIGEYHRTSPPGPWRYKGGKFWNANYVGANELPVFDTDLGRIGMLVCSEVYIPELSRCLAIKGAEMVFLPAGRLKGVRGQLYDTWKTLIMARAFENLMYTITCQNIQSDERALAMICGPDELVTISDKEGIIMAQADIARVREMRMGTDYEDYDTADASFGTKLGTLREWRRPEIYMDILSQKAVDPQK